MSKENPNFTIITSGGCNSKCDFCTDPMNYKPSSDYIKNLMKSIENLPSNFKQVSISGGEPTISPDLEAVLTIVKYSNRFDKVVLTSNGTKLLEKAPIISATVDHLNISRHGVGYEQNVKVFGNKTIPTDEELSTICEVFNKQGIDVNLNYVYTKESALTEQDVMDYVAYAKSVGANCVTFRYDQAENTLEETYLESYFSEYTKMNVGGCPVCRNHTIYVKGMPVVFKASFEEPSNEIGDVYELIYHVFGKLTTDWEGKSEFAKQATKTKLDDSVFMAKTFKVKNPIGGGCGNSFGGGCG